MLFRIYDSDCDGFLQFEELVTMIAHSSAITGEKADMATARAQARQIRSHIGTGMLDRPISLDTFKEAMRNEESELAKLSRAFHIVQTLPSSPHIH